MALMGVVKLGLGVIAASFGVLSCVLWWLSAKAEVLDGDVPADQDGEFVVTHRGREVAVIASARKQSRLSAMAAVAASLAALAQVALVIIQVLDELNNV
ncbi:hypothetical protein [Pseudomonas leptonychotis]|uniref:hypothetical protein n=1 Tax=Pseudomonas leptonychotis TaxID=2448482 RepID=UPI0039F11F36